MSERKLHIAGLSAVLIYCSYCTSAMALEMGFEGLLSVESSDNVEGVNAPDEEDGVTAGALIGVYGEQRSRALVAGFRGEIDSRKLLSDDDSSINTVSRFLGAAEFSITPRSWRWYIGDILGGVRSDNALQTIDDTSVDRRNVFVTGPSFEYDVQGVSRTRARLLYVNQTEDSEELETLYSGSFSYERDTTPGSYFGFSLGDIYTDQPAESASNVANSSESDFNRSTASIFWNRMSGFLTLYGELGVTRYDTDDESLDGLNAEIRAVRELGPKTSFTASLSRDLNDQTLSTVESLIIGNGDSIGLSPEASGFFADTRLTLAYSYQSIRSSLDVGFTLAQLDYQLLDTGSGFTLNADGEDHHQSTAYASLSQRFSSRLRGELGVSYEYQEYDNRVDETDSILAESKLVYRLDRNFELEAGLVHDTATGTITRFNTGVGVVEDVDVTENRVTLGLRWAPPSRASQDLTIELKSLLQ